MRAPLLTGLVAAGLAGTASAQTGTATYSVAFGTEFGPNAVVLKSGESTDVFVRVAWTTGGNPPPSGLSDGSFDITGAGGQWAVDANPASPSYSLPNPWGAQASGGVGVRPGHPQPSGISGVIWGYGFLWNVPHPFPQNPARVWRGTYTAGAAAGVFPVTTTPLGPTGVFSSNQHGIPTVYSFTSHPGFGGTITIVPAPAAASVLLLAGLVTVRRRR